VRDASGGGDKRFDAWMLTPMNNAKLLPFGLYDQWVPAFAAVFRAVGDWGRFYQRVDSWGGCRLLEKAALRS
jgi:predicted aminopeptidase